MTADERTKDILFIVFIIAVIMLAAAYFHVPERALFMENQIKWWGEFKSFF